jgi:hypothetical protein
MLVRPATPRSARIASRRYRSAAVTSGCGLVRCGLELPAELLAGQRKVAPPNQASPSEVAMSNPASPLKVTPPNSAFPSKVASLNKALSLKVAPQPGVALEGRPAELGVAFEGRPIKPGVALERRPAELGLPLEGRLAEPGAALERRPAELGLPLEGRPAEQGPVLTALVVASLAEERTDRRRGQPGDVTAVMGGEPSQHDVAGGGTVISTV